MDERRSWPRLNIDLSARYRMMNSPEFVYQATVINIGAQGICFLAKQTLKLSDEVELQINLHDREKIMVMTKVMWVKALKNKGEVMAGVKIIDTGKKDEEKFFRFYCRQILIAPKAEHKILIIDEERDTVKLLKIELERKNYVVLCAHDGMEGYERFLQVKPDLVILDLTLPKLNGYALCRKIRRENKDTQTPILILTAKKEDEDRIIGRVIGAEKYVTKPFEIDSLLGDIETLLQQSY